MAGQSGFFDVDERYAALSAAGDPLARLAAVVDFEIFRPVLDAALARSDRSRGGRPPYDAVLMFRILVLQALYSLSDEQAEFQLRDRLSFVHFAGFGLHQAVPDAKTIWLYREQLKQAGAIEGLFRRFDAVLAAKGFLAMGGRSSTPRSLPHLARSSRWRRRAPFSRADWPFLPPLLTTASENQLSASTARSFEVSSCSGRVRAMACVNPVSSTCDRAVLPKAAMPAGLTR
jgi:hypothetical protein